MTKICNIVCQLGKILIEWVCRGSCKDQKRPYAVGKAKENAQTLAEKRVGLILIKMKLLGQPRDELLNTLGKRYKHYKAIKNSLKLRDDLLWWKNSKIRTLVKF